MISERKLEEIITEKVEEMRKLNDFQGLILKSHEKDCVELGDEAMRDMISFYTKQSALKGLIELYIDNFGEDNEDMNMLKEVIYKRIEIYEGQFLNMVKREIK